MRINGLFGFVALLLVAVACSENPGSGADAGAPPASSGGNSGLGGSGGSAGAPGGDPGQGGGTAGSGGGPAGSGGSGGSVGTGGTAGVGQPDGGAGNSGTPEVAPPAQNFNCTLVLGAFQTSQWYDGGFETAVGTEHWEIKAAHNLWTERWANPNDSAWSIPTVSPCATGATTPDRVLFVVYKNFMVAAAPPAVWEPEITKDVENIKTHYPSAKLIELLTLARGPNNQLCPNNTSRNISIAPEIDAAIQAVSDKSGGTVKPGPKYYVPDCSMFEGNTTTLTAGTGAKVAPQLIEYYKPR